MDAKGGLQDVRFGLDTARLANRRLIERAGDLLYYERTNEAPILANAKVKIAYGFIKNKLVSIRVRTTETNDSENLLYGLRLAYGPEDAPGNYTNPGLGLGLAAYKLPPQAWVGALVALRFDRLGAGSQALFYKRDVTKQVLQAFEVPATPAGL